MVCVESYLPPDKILPAFDWQITRSSGVALGTKVVDGAFNVPRRPPATQLLVQVAVANCVSSLLLEHSRELALALVLFIEVLKYIATLSLKAYH